MSLLPPRWARCPKRLLVWLGQRRLTWARPEPDPADWRLAAAPDWAELEVELGWTRPDAASPRTPAGWNRS